MIQERPTVSIGIPVFNGAETLRHTLDALLAQSFSDFEIVISDNASTDNTEEICREYAAADPRIRYSRNARNLGARANYNRVFDLARGEFFRWNSHNDWIDPTYLERCLDAFRQNPRAVACFTGKERVYDDLSQKRVRPARRIAVSNSQISRLHDSLWRMPYHPIFGMFRTSVLKETDLIPNCPEPDRVTLVQVALMGPFTQVDEVLFFQRRPPRGRKVWTWLDPENEYAPKRRILRVTRELWRSVDRFATGGRLSRAIMKADALLFLAVGGVRGKVKQLIRPVRRRRELRRFSGATADQPPASDRAP